VSAAAPAVVDAVAAVETAAACVAPVVSAAEAAGESAVEVVVVAAGDDDPELPDAIAAMMATPIVEATITSWDIPPNELDTAFDAPVPVVDWEYSWLENNTPQIANAEVNFFNEGRGDNIDFPFKE
jgi:hypothetical protein